MGRYIGTTELRQYLSPDDELSTDENGLLSSCISRAEAAINAYTRRDFAGTAGTIYYNRFAQRQVSGQALYLDRDLHTLVALENGDGQVIPIGSVWVEPRNEGPPYRILRLKSAYVWTWNTDAEVTISGTWGFSTVAPDDIKQATTRYAAHLYRQKDVTPNDMSGFQDGGEVAIAKGMPDDVRWLLSPYRSRTGGIV